MNQNHIQLNPILPTITQDWTDLNKDGKKMNKILLMCYTRITPRKGRERLSDDVVLGYISAICRLTHEKTNLVTTVLGVKQALEEYKKGQK